MALGMKLSLACTRRLPALCCCLIVGLGMGLASSSTASAQNREPSPLRLGGVAPAGLRNSVTESWGAFDFNVTNLGDADRDARVVVFYNGSPDVQYGRDVWVPARSTLSTWMLVGPAPAQQPASSREIQFLLFDRSEGNSRLVPPAGDERVRSRGVFYRKREPYTAIMLNEDVPEPPIPGQVPQPEPRDQEAFDFARTLRCVSRLSDLVTRINPGPLPSSPEAFDGIDHFVLASGRIADDSAGMQALRRWLERGGTVWVMLDIVEPVVVAGLLGDAFDFQVVDRVSLTTSAIVADVPGQRPGEQQAQEHKRPVEFVRVLLPSHEPVQYTVNGWPAWFTRQVGRGKVIFTTLGPRAWSRPRQATDRPSPCQNFPSLPIPTAALEELAAELQPPAEEHPFRVEAFGSMLTQEIGYAIISRGTAVLVYAAFLLAVLALGLVLRRSRRSELLCWLGPAAALGAAAAFLALGELSRRTTSLTVAVGQIVDADTGTEEAAVHGLLAVYRPDSGPMEVGAEQGGFFDLDMTGLEGLTRRLVFTDQDSWHWENLALPAGIRFAPFRFTAATQEPIRAVAGFGLEGIEGNLTVGTFQGLADALLNSPGARKLALQLRPDGAFRAGSRDILPAGQFLAGGAVLTDRQQRRQELYRAFLKQPAAGRLKGRNLMVWAEPIDMHFTLPPKARLIGDALLVVPLRLKRSPSGTPVTIPGPLIPCRRVMDQGLAPPILESSLGAAMHLRFQLPVELLPLKVERARLAVKIDAPSRRVTIAGQADSGTVELHSVASPLDPIRVDINQEQLLHLDGQGGLHVHVSVSDSIKGAEQGQATVQKDETWTIEYLELEVTGRIGKDEG